MCSGLVRSYLCNGVGEDLSVRRLDLNDVSCRECMDSVSTELHSLYLGDLSIFEEDLKLIGYGGTLCIG